MKEFEIKLERIRQYCAITGYDGMYLSRRANFSWLSCGGNNTVERSSEYGVADFLVMKDRCFVITSEIERYRIIGEELGRTEGFELVTFPWGGTGKTDAVNSLVRGFRIVSDIAMPGMEVCVADIAELRYVLTDEEESRYRQFALEATLDLENVCRSITPGMTEYDTASLLMAGSLAAGGDAPVVLVAFDERMDLYRHPVPTEKKLARRALLARCSERGGLIVSISRIVSFGKPDAEFTRRHRACAAVNAAFIAATTTGAKCTDIFSKGVAAYAASGYPDEWLAHHQGGALGYAARDYVIDSSYDSIVRDNQAFSWNPTIAGTKIEDTMIVKGYRQDILTDSGSWPRFDVGVGSVSIRCPDILNRG